MSPALLPGVIVKVSAAPLGLVTTCLGGDTEATRESCETAYTVVRSCTVTVTVCGCVVVNRNVVGCAVIVSVFVRAWESVDGPTASACAVSSEGTSGGVLATPLCDTVEFGATPAPPLHAINDTEVTSAMQNTRKFVTDSSPREHQTSPD